MFAYRQKNDAPSSKDKDYVHINYILQYENPKNYGAYEEFYLTHTIICTRRMLNYSSVKTQHRFVDVRLGRSLNF